MKEKNMRKEIESEDELRPEYDLTRFLKTGIRGKYAERYKKGTNLVLLDSDVARAFPNEKAVNEALRLVMQLIKIQLVNHNEISVNSI